MPRGARIFVRVPAKEGDDSVGVCGGCVGDCALCDASPCFCKLNLKLPAQLAAELQWCASVNYAVLMQCVQYGCSLSQHKRVFCQWPLAQLCPLEQPQLHFGCVTGAITEFPICKSPLAEDIL